jgi:hypothetical protein
VLCLKKLIKYILTVWAFFYIDVKKGFKKILKNVFISFPKGIDNFANSFYNGINR